MDGTGELFESFVGALPEGFKTQIVRYPTNRPLPSSELAKLLRSAVECSDAFVLIAESFSSPLAIELAATNPPSLRGLVICSGFASSPIPKYLQSICSFFAPVCFLVSPPSVAIKLFLVGFNCPIGMVAAVKSAISSVNPWVLSARLRSVLACDVRSALSRVTVPMLIIRPSHDRLVGVVKLEEMRRIKPSAAVETVSGPHLLFQREPHRSAEIVARFASQWVEEQPRSSCVQFSPAYRQRTCPEHREERLTKRR